jgi:endo-1,4-beta-xylanase
VLAGTRFLRGPSYPWWLHGHRSTSPAAAETRRDSGTLRAAAEHAELLIGAAVRPLRLSELTYAATLAREFNLIEPEDAMKWEILHRAPDGFDFVQADTVARFASEHGMKVRGHTLVWHRQNPKWLTNGKYTSRQLSQILEEHVKTVVGHFRGKVYAWDVVNEAFDEVELGKLRSTIWYDRPGIGLAGEGTAYIERCFRWAHEADPEALLFYNEAGIQAVNAKSDAVFAMVREFKRQGVPIDGVGFEMHLDDLHPDIPSISRNFARFTALGVQVHITEMDVALPVDANGNAKAEDLQKQASVYRDVAEVCLAHPGCTAIQTWGFTDKYSWIGTHSKQTRGAALLFDRDYQRKPAYQELLRTLEKGKPAH